MIDNALDRAMKVSKESISSLLFPKAEVLISKTEIENRNEELSKALVLGNVEHLKVRLYFEDIEGSKVVETTIWGMTSNDVILKQNVVIPINRVVAVEIL